MKPGDTLNDPILKQHLSEGQYEYVDVTFTAVGADTIIPYSQLTPENPDDVRWIDVTPGAINNGGSDSVASIYRSALPAALPWGRGYVVLRCSVAGYSTRLKLFVERS